MSEKRRTSEQNWLIEITFQPAESKLERANNNESNNIIIK